MEATSTTAEALQLLQSIEDDARPMSLLVCVKHNDDELGLVDLDLHMAHAAKQDEMEELESKVWEASAWTTPSDQSSSSRDAASKPVKRRKRSCKSLRPHYFDEEGKEVFLQPRQTVWY